MPIIVAVLYSIVIINIEIKMRYKRLFSGFLLTGCVCEYGSEEVVSEQNNTTPEAVVVIAASSEASIDPSLSFVYRDQRAFSIEAIQTTFSDQRNWQAIDFGGVRGTA